MTSYERREIVSKRVEFIITTSVDGMSATDVNKMQSLIQQELQHANISVDEQTIRFLPHDSAIVISYEVETTMDEVNEQLRASLAAALGVYEQIPWQHLLKIAATRTAYTTAHHATSDRPVDENAPIPALLPRNWPEIIDRECQFHGFNTAWMHRIKRMIDGWVLSATPEESTDDAG